jgi:hypothetical protein
VQTFASCFTLPVLSGSALILGAELFKDADARIGVFFLLEQLTEG